MLIGYARVSTTDQNLDLQTDALKKEGCERIYTDKASGSKFDRNGLNEALEYLREGDTLVIWKLDRLGRSMKGLIEVAESLAARNVGLKSITDSIDTGTVAGKFFFNIMAALATMERDLIKERTLAGLEAARKAGRVGGRKRKMTPEKIENAKVLLEAGKLPKDIAQTLNVSIATLYRHCPANTAKYI